MKYLAIIVLVTACEYITACTPDCPQPEPVVKEQLAPSEAACIEYAGRGGTTKVECKAEPAPAPAPVVKKEVKKVKAAKPKAK